MARAKMYFFLLTVSTIMTEAVASRKSGVAAVLILRNAAVVSAMAGGVPMTATKLFEKTKRMAAMTLVKVRMTVMDVRIG